MSIKFFNNNISKVYFGSNLINKIYQGSIILYSSEPPSEPPSYNYVYNLLNLTYINNVQHSIYGLNYD
ncbi:MAG: hypothetical protein EBU90_21475 [Proteobacteria bacterium]|nr:hypothetical protein [Pseudomonadota bacterium]NBP15056.1 hypothetical protein [bacterium]